MGLNGVADVAEGGAWANRGDAPVQALLSHPRQPLGQHRRLAHQKHLARVPVVAVLDDGDVDVEDVTALQRLLRRWDAVADHMVDRSADRAGEWRNAGAVAVVQRRRNAVYLIDDVAVADVVELVRGHARPDMLADHLEHAGGQAPGAAHAFDVSGVGGFGVHGRLWYKPRRFGATAPCRGCEALAMTKRTRSVANPRVPAALVAGSQPRAGAVQAQRRSGFKGLRRLNPEATIEHQHARHVGRRRTLRPSNPLLESEDGAVHFRRQKQDTHP